MRPGVPRAREVWNMPSRATQEWHRRRAAGSPRSPGGAAMMDVDIGIRSRSNRRRCASPRTPRHDGGHVRVHRPDQLLVAGGPELASGHEHHIGEFRSASTCLRSRRSASTHSIPIPRVFLQALLAEAGNAHDPFAGRGAFSELRERWANLSADAEDDDVARKVFERGDQGRRGGHHLLEVLHVAEAIRQRGDWVIRGLVLERSRMGCAISNQLDTSGPDIEPASERTADARRSRASTSWCFPISALSPQSQQTVCPRARAWSPPCSPPSTDARSASCGASASGNVG
jgi:hypothetical protein